MKINEWNSFSGRMEEREIEDAAIKNGAQLILDERVRQVCKEGFLPKGDVKYQNDELIQAAVCYCSTAAQFELGADVHWPWNAESFKHTTPIRDLVKAGALIAAEIDRLQQLLVVKG